jgi:glycosyltransferase 2 family protein
MDDRPGARRRTGRALALGAAAVAGLALVTLVFFRPAWHGGLVLSARFDLGGFARRLPEHRHWLVPFVLLTAVLPAWRALVWRAVLPPPAPAYADVWHSTAMGALVHNAVPGKVGPLAAAWLLARFHGVPFGAALSTQLVAKLLELAAVVALGAVAIAARGGHGAVARAAAAGAALVAALGIGAALLARFGRRAALRLAERHPRLSAFVGAAGDGVRAVGSASRLARAFVVALVPPLTAAAAYGLPLRAFGVDGAAAGGAILLAMVTFGQLTPGLPVGTGVYYALAAFTARRLGASAEDAAALAVLSHAATVATLVGVGLASAVVRRSALRELLRRRRELGALGAAPPAPRPAARVRHAASDARSRSPT